MNPRDFRDIRMRLGLNEAEYATELGYTGKGKNRVNLIRDFESGRKQIPLYIARLAWLIDRVLQAKVPFTAPPFANGMIDWPAWPGYTREELDAGNENE